MKNSSIEWCDHTFNPWEGCTKVSEGCKNCYAEVLVDKRFGRAKWGKGNPRRRTSEATWKQPLKWNQDAAWANETKEVIKEHFGKEYHRPRVFCASLADVFDEEVPDEWRWDLFGLIANTPNLDWLLLTKRPEKALEFFTDKEMVNEGCCEGAAQYNYFKRTGEDPAEWFAVHFPLPNVWIGTSVENQEMADKRIPILLKIPGAVRFLSMEPLLGPIDLKLTQFAPDPLGEGMLEYQRDIQWVIVGGESGHNARPMHPDWARSIRDQCQSAKIPFLFKQWGEWTPYVTGHHYTAVHTFSEEENIYPDGALTVKKIGKKGAGRLLDHKEYNEFPVLKSEISNLKS